MKRKRIILLSLIAILSACSIKYSFTGASISPSVRTYTIYDFPNRARIINPTLSDYFVEKLRDKFTRQTNLDYQNDGGDLEFEGSIVGYDIKPISVQEGDITTQNRLTIRVNVVFRNNQDSEQNFEQEFSAFTDFSSEFNIADVEDELVETIVDDIIEDIYNQSVASW